LDRAAREHVLRRWVFEPSLRNGIAVPAYARVPVRFTLP
jgi:outer membrane biosynthesis protein TonB